jgi:hypothetical protein
MSKKINLFNSIFSKGNKTIKSFVNSVSQENIELNQNNNYRSSSPWYTLITESEKIKSIGKYEKNNKFLCGFRFDNVSVQKLVDAAFSKCFDTLLDEEIYNENDLRSKLIDFIIGQHLLEKSANEIVKAFKKLDIEMLNIY